MVKINGEMLDAAGKTVLQLLTEMQCSSQRVAVEYNAKILPKQQYAETILKDGDNIEVVQFVGGG